jgi:addiction module HigA family antidote
MTIHEPLHPGAVVKDVLIENARLSVTQAAERLGVQRTTLSRLINGHAGISPEMALRLAKLCQTSVDMWINLQAQYDIDQAQKHMNDIDVKPLNDAA